MKFPFRKLRRELWNWLRLRWPRKTPPRINRVLPHVYLFGEGLEIGALHNPQRLPFGVRVRYVDRMSNEDLLRHYPDLGQKYMVPVEIVDDGERLDCVDDASQDFVIAGHFLEHCQDPIGTLKQFFRVLKPKGIAYITIPDKRYTFDCDRPLTTLAHLQEDHDLGPERYRRQHFEEYVRFVHRVDNPAEIQRQADELLEQDFSIHYHVWTQHEILELLLSVQREIGFEIENFSKNRHEVICVLRKHSPQVARMLAPTPVGYRDLSSSAHESDPEKVSRFGWPELDQWDDAPMNGVRENRNDAERSDPGHPIIPPLSR